MTTQQYDQHWRITLSSEEAAETASESLQKFGNVSLIISVAEHLYIRFESPVSAAEISRVIDDVESLSRVHARALADWADAGGQVWSRAAAEARNECMQSRWL